MTIDMFSYRTCERSYKRFFSSVGRIKRQDKVGFCSRALWAAVCSDKNSYVPMRRERTMESAFVAERWDLYDLSS